MAAGTTFAGTAMSVTFAGPTGYIGFDNVTFGSADPTSPIVTPEPATVLLVGTPLLLLAGVGAARRRRGAAAD